MALLTMPVSFTPLALIALLVTPETAIAASFLDEIVAADKLMARAMEKAAQMQELHGKAYAGNKRLVRGALTAKMTAELNAGAGLNAVV